MKRILGKRSDTDTPQPQIMRKPYGFCCDAKDRKPEMRYNARNPPFVSSLTDVVLDSGGPDLKFRIQDSGRAPFSIQRGGISKIKGAAFLGQCKRCRGPLKWFLEDEIAAARDLLAKERREKNNSEFARNVQVAKKKERHRNKKVHAKKRKRTDERNAIQAESTKNQT